MSNISKEQRAHDLALLWVQTEIDNKRANNSGNIDVDLLEMYIERYNTLMVELPN